MCWSAMMAWNWWREERRLRASFGETQWITLVSLAAWLVLNRVRTPGALKHFDGAGYRYDKAASTPLTPVFVRAFADRR